MTGLRIGFRAGTGATLALALAACGGGPRLPKASAPPRAEVPAANRLDTIVALLDRGEARAARKQIAEALKADPMDARLLLLRDSIERDPTELLGPKSYPYEARPGDTMGALAERLLGNRLKAYQLARYNGIENPSSLAAGTVLRIPGTPPRPAPAVRREPPATPRAATPSAPRAKPAAPPVAPAARPAANPAAAAQARRAGLAALNRGNAAQAAMLLRRAAALAPNDPAIARDRDRAERIARTVRARR